MMRRAGVFGLAMAFAIATISTLAAQVRFDRPLSVVVPYPPGGSIDVSIRIIGEKVTALGGPTVIVQNKPGAGGIVAAMAVKQTPPDGQTLLVGDHGLFGILPVLTKDMPFDSVRDFAPVALLRSHYQICALPKALPAETVADFLALARRTPGGLSYASQSPGSSGHILGAMLAIATNAPLVHVPYRGEAPAVADLVSGQVAMLCTSYDGLAAQIAGDTLKVMAVARKDRDPLLPNVPTFAESGVEMDDFLSWNGLLVNTGTPQPIVDELGRLFTTAVNSPDVAGRLRERGINVPDGTPGSFGRFIEAYSVQVEKILRKTGVTLD